MLVRTIFLSFTLMIANLSIGQNEFFANRLCSVIELDGLLEEPEWACSDSVCNFTVTYPNFGEVSRFQSFVKLLYDDEAIYVGAILYDPNPDSISYNLSQRDDFGNGDWFGIRIDPYATNRTAFLFAVTAAGVEVDAIEYIEDTDFSWNAVWKSVTHKGKDGWSVEMRIPLSAIRFPEKEIQEWNINIGRQVRRNRETSYWNPLDPNIYGEITQSGVLRGIENIRSPLRLSLSPYITGYLENNYDPVLQKQRWNQRLTGGVDLKYGVNQAFTIDMTLIPDFGQTRSDQQILNLSPFEVRYNENRPFFLEGMDLFSIGEVFYTRRIGGTPYNRSIVLNDDEVVKSNPVESPIINASKFSGRTTSGLGIGVFNGIEGHTYATISDSLGNSRQVLTNPLSNYNVLVLSQNMKNNGIASFVNTNVIREGGARDANVSVGTLSVFSKDKQYKIDGTVKQSIISEVSGITIGHAFSTSLNKVSGTWRYGINYSENSDTYDPNDLGFLTVNNNRTYSATLRWNDFTAGKHMLRRWANLSATYNELYSPQLFTSMNIDWSAAGTYRNFLTAGVNGGFSPLGTVDHFESRSFGKELRYGPSIRIGGFYSSDYSKPFALDLRTSITNYTENRQMSYSFTVSPRLRFGDRMFLVWNSTISELLYDIGYVFQHSSDFVNGRIIMGRRDRIVLENTLSGEYIFTNRMGIDVQFRHYWQQVNYLNFFELRSGGELIDVLYDPLDANGNSVHNTSYNAFTLDVNYRWVFYPGCELRLVYKNNIFHFKSELDKNYFSTFNTLFDQPQINSISMKLLVFLDALYFRPKKKATP
ncbi:MAG: hypothetical protein EP333_04875 [Bacteroidetes bacterium]|nr:MAG: hypothetical protein EP333_04875 [Bacteroidota bacterium]